MFCTKCGNSMNDNNQFCTKCGAKLEIPGVSKNNWTSNNFNQMQNNNVIGKTNDTNRIILFAIITLFILMGIFFFTPTFETSVWGMGQKLDIFDGSEITGLKPIAFVVFAASAAALFIPIFTKKIRLLYLFPAMVTSFLTVILFMITFTLGSSELKRYGANISLTGTGWIVVWFGISTIILSVLLIVKSKRENIH